MKTTAYKLLALLLLMVATGAGRLCAQYNQLYNNDTTYCCVISYLGNVSFSYGGDPDPFDGWGVVSGLDSTFTLTLNFTSFIYGEIASVNGYIDIWDGDPEDSLLLIHGTAPDLTNRVLPHVTSDHVTFHLHYDSHFTNYHRSFSLHWQSSDYSFSRPNPCATNPNIHIDSITTTGAVLHYYPNDVSMYIVVNGQSYIATGGRLPLVGLAPNTRYVVCAIPVTEQEYPCCRKYTDFYTNPIYHIGFPNVLDLHTDYVRCIYNDHPYWPSIGIRDFGPGDIFSQHTVHTDTNEFDPLLDSLLHTVGPGLPGSVRLGNQMVAGSESITYYLHVDTTLYSMILLHYAAILQNPGHSAASQPHFTMQILDQNDSVIDPQCGAADFAADSSLGWNTIEETIWKDWTTVGISLSQYHGQNVRLKFATRDCALGGHFGYAYFYAEGQQPSVTSEHCGTVDTNTLTAPDGFNYLWYYDTPSNPVSTAQSYTYSTDVGTIHCQLSFIENPSCHITLSTYVSTFWPHAIADTLYTVDRGCDGYEVHFYNRSTILGDDSIPQPNNPPCESAQWNFGDGYISGQYQPTHTYRHPGTYLVTLIARLNGGQCTDTTTFVIEAPDAWAPSDQYLACCDSLLWLDSLWYSRDTVGPSIRINYPETCDTVYTLHLSTLPSSHYYFPPDTFCYNSRYYWRGQTIPVSPDLNDTLFHNLTDTLTAANGCDSILHLELLQLPVDPLNIEVEPDCGMGLYLLTAGTEKPYWSWSSSPHDPALEEHETDRQLWVAPDTTVTYSLTSYYGDSLFCPSTTAKRLSPPAYPEIQLEVNPDVLTYDKHILYAYDNGSKYNHHVWTLVLHGTTHDTVHLPDSLPRITYPVPIDDYDSVTVILDVENNFCRDTVFQTIPIVRSALFAPNVFTPDANTNNRFTIILGSAIEAELTIYNRQGLFVYSTHDLEQGWDGTHNGTPCPQGAYVWHLHYRTLDRPDDWNAQIGTVTLLR